MEVCLLVYMPVVVLVVVLVQDVMFVFVVVVALLVDVGGSTPAFRQCL